MNIISSLQSAVAQSVEQLYGEATDPSKVLVNTTPPDFSGDYSIVIFPFVKIAKKSPDAAAAEIGALLQENVPEIKSFNVVKGFLNLEISIEPRRFEVSSPILPFARFTRRIFPLSIVFLRFNGISGLVSTF